MNKKNQFKWIVGTPVVTGIATIIACGVVSTENKCANSACATPSSSPSPSPAADTAPTPGTAISTSAVTATKTTVSWGAATDSSTATANLQYKVVKATASTSIDTLAKIDAITTVGAGLVQDWTANQLSVNLTGLLPSTTYYYAVAVRNDASMEAIYTPTSALTTQAIWMYQSLLTYQGPSSRDIGNRTASTAICTSDASSYTSLPGSCTNHVALLGYSGDNGVTDIPTNYSLPTTRSFVGPTGILVADTWTDLLALTNVQSTMNTALVLGHSGALNIHNDGYAWTGFSGTTGAADTNCTNWSTHASGNAKYNVVGSSGTWGNLNGSCTGNDLTFICLCW